MQTLCYPACRREDISVSGLFRRRPKESWIGTGEDGDSNRWGQQGLIPRGSLSGQVNEAPLRGKPGAIVTRSCHRLGRPLAWEEVWPFSTELPQGLAHRNGGFWVPAWLVQARPIFEG